MRFATCLLLALGLSPTVLAGKTRTMHGMSLFGSLKYPADFRHYDYVDPKAPKGGEVRQAAIGTFDSLNQFIIKGSPAASLGLIYDTLMDDARDEPASEYGRLAESVEVPDDLSWVAFTLSEEARWHDGQPITPADVIFTFELLKKKGTPGFRYYYANVMKPEATGPRTVKFSFTGPKNRELPQIVGQMTVLPKHYWEGRDFEATTLEPPLGSGPYRIDGFEAGRWIRYARVEDYWARDLPTMKGRYNFDSYRIDYYREDQIALESFKARGFDFRMENNSKLWATSYRFPAVEDGRVVTELLDHELPSGMQGFVFNLRRAKFRSPQLRRALAHAFDFEWSNRTLFYGQYTRSTSYFSNSDLAATGLPSEAELALLEPLRGRIPDEVFTETYAPPKSDGSGNIRAQLRQATRLLKSAGFEIRDGKLIEPTSGKPFTMEILLGSPAFQRVVAPMVENLRRLGVEASIRVVDSAQYRRRLDTFDFDMIVSTFGQSLSPGNEQRNYWGSASADRKGSFNYIGIKDPAIDELIDHVIFAEDRATLIAACRALDRVLLWGHYVIPNWHIRSFRVAYWNRFARPAIRPKYGLGFFDTWWIDPAKEAAMQAEGTRK